MKVHPFSDVVLAVDVPGEDLKAGDIGTLVERHAVDGQEDGYSVEFFDNRGQTVAVATVPASALRLRPRLSSGGSRSTSVSLDSAGPVNMRWKDNLLQLLAGIIGAVLGGVICYQTREYLWWGPRSWLWRHYGFWITLFFSVGGLIVGVFVVGLFLMIYRRSWLTTGQRR